MLVIVSIIHLCFIIDFSWAECFSINSKKHGKLYSIEREKLPEKCIKGLSFQKKETGKMFCLKKGRQTDSLTCAQANCFCGKENIPSDGIAEIIGGDEVDRNQYPWYALLINIQGNRHLKSPENHFASNFQSFFKKHLTNCIFAGPLIRGVCKSTSNGKEI